ncbi:unnamed protein product [Allacma fusca]|uniref:Uncharacterized protein n=1 Tax=Allacma fusca TaxID=39272 RepID=A0A8J2KTR6_9HEXA|nr:unnamed protein product [Allacma fusca]
MPGIKASLHMHAYTSWRSFLTFYSQFFVLAPTYWKKIEFYGNEFGWSRVLLFLGWDKKEALPILVQWGSQFIDDAILGVTKGMELLESPSRTTAMTEPPTPRPTWKKPRSRFSIIRAKAYAEEPAKYSPCSEMTSTSTVAQPGSSDKSSTDGNLKKELKSFAKNPKEATHQALTPIFKTYGRSKMILRRNHPELVFPAKADKPAHLAPFSKSEPSPMVPVSTEEEDPNWLLFKSPLLVPVNKASSKRGRKKSEPKKKLPLKRNIYQANHPVELNNKRPRKQQLLLKDISMSPKSSKTIAAPRPHFFRLRTKPGLQSSSRRRTNVEKGKGLAGALNPPLSDESSDEDEGLRV